MTHIASDGDLALSLSQTQSPRLDYTHTNKFVNSELDDPLVLSDQPGLKKLEYSDKYLVVKERYVETEQWVLDVRNNEVIVARRNNSSPVQKWIVNTTGNN